MPRTSWDETTPTVAKRVNRAKRGYDASVLLTLSQQVAVMSQRLMPAQAQMVVSVRASAP